MPSKTLILALGLGLAAVILLPLTSLWAFFAYLGGNKYPLFALRGKNIEDSLDGDEEI